MKFLFRTVVPLVLICSSTVLPAQGVEELTTQQMQISKMISNIVGKFVGGFARDYYRALEISEAKDINYIITTLANASLTKIWQNKGKLEKAGDRIENVHPLRFLEIVFNNEELKVGIHLIKDRGWVAKDFFGGIYESLDSELKIGNMKDEYIEDFAKNVGIDVTLINAPIQDAKWQKLIDTLIVNLPRTGDHDRYDI